MKTKNTNTPVANAISESEGKPVVNGAKQISANTTKKTLGRPKVEGSERQKKLAAIEAKRAENGGYLPLGRPAVPGSKRALALAQKQADKEAGIVAPKGRPKMTEEAKAEAKEKREVAKAEWMKRMQAKAEGVQVTEAIAE